MSHFSVLVIGNNIEDQLQPFHEFECTGTDDQYVQDVDRTEEALADYAEATVTRFRAPDGTLHDPYDHRGNYKPEFSREGEHGRKERFVPAGWEEVEVTAKDHEPAAKWISGYYGWSVLTVGNEPREEHKYGRIEVDADGNIIRCIDRTNPNKKWDWWQVGGRWSGVLKLKDGAKGATGKPGLMGSRFAEGADRVDQARKGDIDWQGMRDQAAEKAGAGWDKVRAVTGDLDDLIPWQKMREEVHAGDITTARAAYSAQRAIEAISEASKNDRDLVWITLEDFTCTRDEYMQRAADSAGVSFALLMDGKWYERGEMGWWACVSNEKDKDEWNRQFHQLIDGLHDDTMLTVVDCHI